MPTARLASAAAAVDGIVYVVGGYNEVGGFSLFASNEAYDPVTDTWSTKAPMPTARYGLAAAAVNGIIYAVGGNNGGTIVSTMEAYDPVTNTWTTKASMPTPRSAGLAAVSVNGIVYAIGGYNSGSVSTVEAYDPTTNTWSSKAAMPTARYGVAAAAVDGIVYAIGGYNSISGTNLNTVEAYDPTTNTWSSKAAMPTARYWPAAAAANGIVYAVSGYIAGDTDPASASLATVEAYDPATNAWSTKTPMPTAASYVITVEVNGVIYAVGGLNASGVLATNQAYTPFSAPAFWATKAPMPTARLALAAAEVNGIVYALGGYNEVGGFTLFASNEAYDRVTNSWSVKAPMPTSRYTFAAAAVNGIVYAVGGERGSFGGAIVDTVEAYDPVTNTWTTKAPMPSPRSVFAAVAVNGILYVIGGTNNGDLSTVEAYDPTTNTWSSKAPMPTARYGVAATAVDGIVYAIGGYSSISGTNLNTVEAYDPRTNSWSSRAGMPTARYYPAAAEVNGIVYAVAGYIAGDAGNPFLATVEAYDPTANAWSNRTPLTTPASFCATVEVNGVLYAVGGLNASGALATNQAFTPDTEPPTTTATPSIGPNGNGWNNTNVGITLNATDNVGGSGVQSMTYSLGGAQSGGGTFAGSSTSVTIFNEGTTSITFHSADLAGNVEADHTLVVKIDKTQPFVSSLPNLTVSATSSAGAVVTFGIQASDALSGIASTQVSPLSSGMTFPHGTTSESVTVTDMAGNSTFRNFSVTVNKTLQSITVSPSTATINLGQSGQQFTATGHFTDGSTPTLPSGSGGGGGGGSVPAGATWQLQFPSLNTSACAGTNFISQGISPTAGVVHTSWGTPGIVQVDGTVTAQQVNLTLGCIPANGATGSISATWTGTRYEGTATLSGATTAVSVTGWSTKASLQTPRFSFGAATVNGIVYAMGGTGSPGFLSDVDAYNPATNSWSTVSQMLTSREGAAIAALNGKIYVAGGHVAGGFVSGVFEAYDPAANSWSSLPAMPTARAGAALVAAGGTLYAIGGNLSTGGSPVSPTATVESYDPSANLWTARASMTTARSFLVAGALNNDATIVATSSGTTELYDVAANGWTAGPAMLASGGSPAAVVVNNALFVFGIGSAGTGVQMFRPTGVLPTGWAALASMPTGRGQLAVAAVGDVVYAIGGQVPGGSSALATVEAFSTAPPSNFSVSSGSGGGGGGGSSLPTVSWQSTNRSIAGINSFGFATANSPGQTTIVASAGGITCQPAGCATLTVADTTPPNLSVPQQPWITTATSAAGATVTYQGVFAFDNVDGIITPSCTPASGSNFPIGSTTVSCTATDAHGNSSAKTFTVQVNDRLTVHVPSPITAEATSAAGAPVPFAVSATYFLGGSEPVQCYIITGFVGGEPQIGAAVSSGATFPLGTSTVGCEATSATGQHAGSFFTITVQDTTPPVVTTSGNVTKDATSLSGATATFTASAVDSVDGALAVVCTPVSGSTFAIGTTTVTCSATDAHQNTGSATLTVTILSPQQIVASLISQVAAAGYQPNGNLLQNALQNVTSGNVSTACNQLGAFINQVQAQTGKSISAADAALLIKTASDARAAMGC